MSRFYVDALRRSPDFALRAVCDVDSTRSAPYLELPGVSVHHDAATVTGDPAIEVVVVDTPVATHVSLCEAALAAGKHVCCEKPLALTRVDAERLLALANDNGRVLMTAFHRRYNSNLPAPESVRRDGLASVEMRYLERIEEHADGLGWYATPAAAGGGCIVDNGPNAVDVVRHLFGEVSVESVEATRSPTGVDLAADVRGHLEDGAEVLIRLDWAYDGECKELVVRWLDGQELVVDLLAGYTGFKSSLAHEYTGILDELAARIARCEVDPHGLAATAWLEDALAVAA